MDNSFKEIEYYLYNYKNIDSLNAMAEARIKMLEDDISLRSIGYEEKSGPTNRFNSDVENEVIRRDEENYEKIQKLKHDIKNRNNMRTIIEGYINSLDPEDKKLIELRYFSKPKKSWQNVATLLNITLDGCIKIRKNLISNMLKIINEES